MIRKSILVLALMAITSVAALSAEYYWDVASGNWSVGANWDPAGPPATNAWAIIDNGGTANIDTNIVTTAVAQIRVFDGTVAQTGYDVAVTYLIMGDGVATYNMSGGTLSTVYEVQMGKEADSASYFNLSDGTVDFKGLAMGYAADTYTVLTVTGGVLNVENDVIVGQNATFGDAIFAQQGGEVNIGGDLYISYYYDNPFGSDSGYGVYKMEGGYLKVDSNIYVGSSDGANAGFMKLKAGTIEVAYDFIIAAAGSFLCDMCSNHASHATIVVYGEFINNSTQNDIFDISHTTVIMAGGGAGFDAGTQTWDKTAIDMGGVVDYGADLLGLIHNYAIGDLVFKGTDTGSIWYVLESDIYCYGLRIEEGAVVDLNGFNIYYLPIDAMSYNGSRPTTSGLDGLYGDLTGSGANIYMITPTGYVPEPGTIVLIGTGVLGLAAVLRKKYC